MRTFLKCVAAACLVYGCTIKLPTEYTLLICVVDGDTLVIDADTVQTLECADLDSLKVGWN